MDQIGRVDHDQAHLSDLLTTFENLAPHDKAEALRHIIRTQRAEQILSEPSPITSSSPAPASANLNIHSCHICHRLVLIQQRRMFGIACSAPIP